jgi:flagellar basal-body rod protein FlgB
MRLWTETEDVLARFMDVATVRQRIIGANLANVNTPGFRSRDVKFEEMLAELGVGGSGSSIDVASLPDPEIVEREGVTARADGNTVNLEREMGELTRNSLLYQTYVRLLDAQMNATRVAVTGHV